MKGIYGRSDEWWADRLERHEAAKKEGQAFRYVIEEYDGEYLSSHILEDKEMVEHHVQQLEEYGGIEYTVYKLGEAI